MYTKQVLQGAVEEAQKVCEMIGLFTWLLQPPPGDLVARPRLEVLLPPLPAKQPRLADST